MKKISSILSLFLGERKVTELTAFENAQQRRRDRGKKQSPLHVKSGYRV